MFGNRSRAPSTLLRRAWGQSVCGQAAVGSIETSFANLIPTSHTSIWIVEPSRSVTALYRADIDGLRAVSILVIASIALNAYLFYYDAAFLVVPWMIAFLTYTTYAPITRALIVIVAVASWVLALTTPILQQGGVPLPGLVATIWLLVEILDLFFGKRAMRVTPPAEPAPLADPIAP